MVGVMRDVVLAAVVVLAGQFLGDAVEVERVEGLAFGQADALRPFIRSSVLMSLLPARVIGVDGRALGDHLTTRMSPWRSSRTSLKKPVLNSARIASVEPAAVERVALFNRQVGEDGAGGDALQAVDADVGDTVKASKGAHVLGKDRPDRARRGQGSAGGGEQLGRVIIESGWGDATPVGGR